MADLDEALARFQLCGFEYGAGAPNYGPSAAAGLVELGHDALLVGLIDVYAPRLPGLSTGTPIRAGERAAALGRGEAFASWLASFESDLREQTWQELLRSQVPRLVEGISAASVHGVVRTAHAVQGLDAGATGVRVRELAFGLAHWACCFEALPGDEAKDCVASDDLRGAIHRACVEGATRYLADPDQRAARAVGVMGPGAIALLATHLEDATLMVALSRICALAPDDPVPVSGPGQAGSIDDEEVARCAQSPQEIRYRAACSLQEHAIPFVAACLREDIAQPDPILRMAAADAALRLSPAGYQAWR